MADGVAITEGSGKTVATDEVTHGTLGTNIHAQVMKIMDGTVGGIELTKVLAPSTAPVATDPALVVALSPNGMNANGQATMANSAPVVLPSNQAWGVGSEGFTKLEDVAASSGDKGVPAFAVQTATPADAAGDGDWAWLQMKNGRLYVQATIKDISDGEYETVAASQSTQALGATGAAGDYLSHLIVIPATTSPGNVQIKDGANSAITVFAGGADSVATLHPFQIPCAMISGNGAWQVTTGSNVSVIAVGNFT